MKKTSLIISGLALFLLLPLGAYAYAVKTGNTAYVAKDEVISGNYYAAGNTITIEGTVEGDVICAGQTININGKISGDVICAGQSLNINGVVEGSVRVAGNSISINGQVAKNAMVFGTSIYLGSSATVGWDMLLAGATGEIRGEVKGDLHGAGSSVVIAGRIGKNVRLFLDERAGKEMKGLSPKKFQPLEITKDAVIGGNVVYTAGQEGSVAEGAKITGQVTYNPPEIKPVKEYRAMGVWFKLISFFAALVVGLVLISLWRKPVKDLTERMLNKISPAIGWGIVVLFLTPIIVVILMITLIGIPLSLILIALWLIAVYLAKIIAGIAIGLSIMDRLWPKQKDSLIWAMITGVVLLWLIGWIPLIGWLVTLVAIWWGLGGIWLALRKP